MLTLATDPSLEWPLSNATLATQPIPGEKLICWRGLQTRQSIPKKVQREVSDFHCPKEAKRRDVGHKAAWKTARTAESSQIR